VAPGDGTVWKTRVIVGEAKNRRFVRHEIEKKQHSWISDVNELYFVEPLAPEQTAKARYGQAVPIAMEPSGR
jgi:hypothetical protein